MRYFIDTEFMEGREGIDLISIGVVAEDGRGYYAQSVEFNPYEADQWIQQHVFPGLQSCPYEPSPDIHIVRSSHAGFGQCTSDYHAGYGSGQHVAEQIEAGHYQDCPWRTYAQIAKELKAFCNPDQYGTPELWGWCAGYDFVMLCQTFGGMLDLPEGWPHYMRDLQQVLDDRGIADDQLPAQEEGLHNALADAHHLKKLYDYLMGGSRT